MSERRARSRDSARENREERRHRRTETMAPQWVKDYVERHNLQLMFEEAANAVVKAKAEEPAAFLVSLAKRRSYPEAPAPPAPARALILLPLATTFELTVPIAPTLAGHVLPEHAEASRGGSDQGPRSARDGSEGRGARDGGGGGPASSPGARGHGSRRDCR